MDFRSTPPPALPHLPSWTALLLQWSHSGSWAPPSPRTWSETITWTPLWKRLSRGCTSFARWGVQLATGAADTVLLCHHWMRPLRINNCLVQLSYQIWPQKTTEGCPDCWANHWHNPPHSPRTVLIQRALIKGLEKLLWTPHTSTLTLWTVTVWSTLQSSKYQNDQTQEQFLPSSNPSHEHLTIIMVHTLFIHQYTYLSNTHT